MKKIASALVLSAFAASAFAADDGFYVGANVGQASTDTFTLSTKTGTALTVLGGYKANKYFAVEVQYNDLGNIKPGGNGGNVDISGYSADAMGIYPFNDQWSVFGKVGYASTKLGDPVSESKSGVTYGIGGQYNFDPAWGVRLNYETYKVGGGANTEYETANTSVVSVGVVYKF